jgi:predicted DNA-binding protein (MmcQ/YjbR family)
MKWGVCMTIQNLIHYCKCKPGAVIEHPFGDEVVVFKIGNKMFSLITHRDHKLSVNLKCDPELALEMRLKFPAVTEGYHMNKKHWNNVAIDGSIPNQEIYKMIDFSYDLVYSKLKKIEREYLIKVFENRHSYE